MEATALEDLYEEAYQAELAAWKTHPIDWDSFAQPSGRYNSAMFFDIVLVWLPATLVLLEVLNSGLLPTEAPLPPIVVVAVLAGAFLWSQIQERRHCFKGIGPFGLYAYQTYEQEAEGPPPARLDPWSPEAIRKAVRYTRRKILTEQETTLSRVWEAKVASGNALHAAREMRALFSGSTSLLQSARLDALDRLIHRHETINADLEAQERIANDSPQPLLAYLDNLEAELAHRDALERLLNQEERARLLEAETAAVRASVSELVHMVRRCEDALTGLARDLQSRDAAQEELQKAIEA